MHVGGPDTVSFNGNDARQLRSALVYRRATGNVGVVPVDNATERSDTNQAQVAGLTVEEHPAPCVAVSR